MNIHITTKFDIGSKVYNAELYHEYYAEKSPYTIVGVSINISDHTMKTIYHIERDGMLHSTSENFIFKSYEDCKQFVNDYNKRLTNCENML